MQQKKQVYNFDFMRGMIIILLPKNIKIAEYDAFIRAKHKFIRTIR